MRLLMFAAALGAVAVPAAAEDQRRDSPGWSSASATGAVRVHRDGDRDRSRRGEWRRDDDRGDDRDDRGETSDRDNDWGEREYQGDTAWRPGSFNDWWHERPNRAYPAWVARNGKCERMWWSGGDWRC